MRELRISPSTRGANMPLLWIPPQHSEWGPYVYGMQVHNESTRVSTSVRLGHVVLMMRIPYHIFGGLLSEYSYTMDALVTVLNVRPC